MKVTLWDEINKEIANNQAYIFSRLLSKLAKEQQENKFKGEK
jgi:hypothetical protein